MKKVLLAVLAILVVFSAIAVTYAAPGKITLRVAWWGNPVRDARTVKVIEMYMVKNPNVTIETETTGWAGYWDKLASQAAAGNLPDIIQHDYTYLNQYVVKNLLLDLTPYVKAGKLNLSNVSESYLSSGRAKKRLYAVSLGTNATCIIYDPAILQKAGVAAPTPDWTWADFEKMALEIYKKTGVQTLPFGTTDPRLVFEHWVRQTKKAMFNPKDGSSLGFSDRKLLTEFFAMQLRLLKAGALVKPDTAFVTVTTNESPFVKGQSWLNFIQSNQVVAFQAATKRPVGIALFPKIAGAKRPGTFFKPSMFFTVARTSPNKDEAVKFVNYFMNDVEANRVLLAERGIPIVPQIREDLAGMVDPVSKQVFDYINLVGSKYASPIDPADPVGTGEVLKVLRNVEQEVLFGSTSPSDAAAKFMRQANEILSKNKAN